MISKGRRREGAGGGVLVVERAETRMGAGLSSIPRLLPDTLTLLPGSASLPRRPPGVPGAEGGGDGRTDDI